MPNFAARLLLAIALLLAVAGCAGISPPKLEDYANHPVPAQHQIHNIPLISQQDFFCGPAALSALLHYHRQPESQADLAEQVFNERKAGTFQHDMLYALRTRGLIAAPVQNMHDLVAEVAQNNPVLVLLNLAFSWAPKWHYAVVSGYDLDRQLLYLHGGRSKPEIMPFSTFGHTWRRSGYWGYVITRPPRLPATSDIHTLNDLALRFEAINHMDAAAQTYRAIIVRHPKNAHAYFALGNLHLAQERPAVAAELYSTALTLEPENHGAANNLAYALARQQKQAQACTTLNHALSRTQADSADHAMLADSKRELCANASAKNSMTEN